MLFKLDQRLILGSKSPRRKEILKKIGIPFICRSPSFKENFNTARNIKQSEIPAYFAAQKALTIKPVTKNDLILGFDTCVFLGSRILGKPDSPEEALKTLRTLNGKSHLVITGTALVCNKKLMKQGKEITRVTFTTSSDKILTAYAASGEPLDKAGSYGIQGSGSVLVKKIDGCYNNVVGLPVNLMIKMLNPYLK